MIFLVSIINFEQVKVLSSTNLLPDAQTLVAKFFFSKSLVQMFFLQSYNASENITGTTSLPVVSENIKTEVF